MNPELLLAHFNRISEAPDAVPSLRRFILDLAVRGKLVEQNSGDEPASELLKTIQAEKVRVVKEGEIKKLEAFEPVTANDVPFPIPRSWEAIRMGWLARKLGAGSTPLGGKTVYQKDGVPFLRSQNVHDSGIRLDDVALISRATHERMSGTHIQQNDILLNITGASIGRCALVPETLVEGNVSQHVAIIRLFFPAIREFIHLSLISPFFQKVIDDVQVGVSREGLSMQRLRLFPMLLPPLAEQLRIVARVNELMALCDRLEAARDEQERRRDRLVAASSCHLNNGANSEDFCGYARFYLNHLPRLITRIEHLSEFRKTILNLAMRGKIVPQNLGDEPASELLKRIQLEMAHSTKASAAKERSNLEAAGRKDEQFEIPCTWLWVSLNQISFGFRYGTSVKCSYEKAGEPVLRIPNIVNGGIRVEDLKFGLLAKREADELRLRLGDILMVRSNGSLNLVGRAALVEANAVGYCYAGYLVRVRTSPTHLDTRYLTYALNASYIRDQIEKPIRTTVGLKNVNATELGRLMISLPPLDEQHRIVAKITELMGLCDELEVHLSNARTESRKLLEAVLHGTLSDPVGSNSTTNSTSNPALALSGVPAH
jgi:type I restriction enzyme S subunit